MTRPKKLGQFAPLSANYYDDDAIITAGEKAEVLYTRSLAFCASSASDGFISDAQLTRRVGVGLRNVHQRAQVLTATGLFERVDGGYVVRSWLKWNKSTEEIGHLRHRDRERKSAARSGYSSPDRSPDPDPQPPDIPDGPDGFQTESNGNPTGFRAESEPRARGRARPIQSNPIQSTTEVARVVEVTTDRARAPEPPTPIPSSPVPKAPIPDDWLPDNEHELLAMHWGLDLDDQVLVFTNHARDVARLSADWDAAFRNWLHSSWRTHRDRSDRRSLSGTQKAVDWLECGLPPPDEKPRLRAITGGAS